MSGHAPTAAMRAKLFFSLRQGGLRPVPFPCLFRHLRRSVRKVVPHLIAERLDPNGLTRTALSPPESTLSEGRGWLRARFFLFLM